MNNLRRFCAASLLAAMLTVTSLAGLIHTGATEPPPPPDAPATSEEGSTSSTDGVMHTGAADSTLEAALSLLRVVLSIM